MLNVLNHPKVLLRILLFLDHSFYKDLSKAIPEFDFPMDVANNAHQLGYSHIRDVFDLFNERAAKKKVPPYSFYRVREYPVNYQKIHHKDLGLVITVPVPWPCSNQFLCDLHSIDLLKKFDSLITFYPDVSMNYHVILLLNVYDNHMDTSQRTDILDYKVQKAVVKLNHILSKKGFPCSVMTGVWGLTKDNVPLADSIREYLSMIDEMPVKFKLRQFPFKDARLTIFNSDLYKNITKHLEKFSTVLRTVTMDSDIRALPQNFFKAMFGYAMNTSIHRFGGGYVFNYKDIDQALELIKKNYPGLMKKHSLMMTRLVHVFNNWLKITLSMVDPLLVYMSEANSFYDQGMIAKIVNRASRCYRGPDVAPYATYELKSNHKDGVQKYLNDPACCVVTSPRKDLVAVIQNKEYPSKLKVKGLKAVTLDFSRLSIESLYRVFKRIHNLQTRGEQLNSRFIEAGITRCFYDIINALDIQVAPHLVYFLTKNREEGKARREKALKVIQGVFKDHKSTMVCAFPMKNFLNELKNLEKESEKWIGLLKFSDDLKDLKGKLKLSLDKLGAFLFKLEKGFEWLSKMTFQLKGMRVDPVSSLELVIEQKVAHLSLKEAVIEVNRGYQP